MSQSDHSEAIRMLDEYLDGLLSDADREHFAQVLQADAALRQAVERQHEIDASLSRLFAAPSVDELSRTVTREALAQGDRKAPAAADARRRRLLAVAAVLAIGTIAAWRLWSFVQPPPRDIYAPQEWRSLQKVYNDVVAAGFKPDWVCKDEEEFVSTFRKRFREPLVVAQTPSVSAGGLGYCNCITPSTVFVLARVAPDGTLAETSDADAAKVMVFVDRASRDSDQTLPPESSLSLFKQQLGPFVLYEVTPLPKPYVLDLFRQPD